MRVQPVIQPHTDNDTAAPARTTFAPLIECLDMVPGISQMPQGTSRPGSSHIALSSVETLSTTCRPGHEPATEPDSSPDESEAR